MTPNPSALLPAWDGELDTPRDLHPGPTRTTPAGPATVPLAGNTRTAPAVPGNTRTTPAEHAVVLLPGGTAEVIAALRFARERGLPVAVRSGGRGRAAPGGGQWPGTTTNGLLTTMTDDNAAAITAVASLPQQPLVQLRSVSGAVNDVPADATAYAPRHQNTLVIASSPPLQRPLTRKIHGPLIMVASPQLKPSDNTPRAVATSLTLRHRHLPGTSLIAVGGEVDLSNSGRLADYIDRIRRPGDHVVLDLTELSFLDCSGLRVLISSARRAGDDHAGVRLAGACGVPARLLELVRLRTLLPMHNTVEQALAAVLAPTN